MLPYSHFRIPMTTRPATRQQPRRRSTDDDLIVRLRNGEAAALEELLQREWSRLVSYAERLTGGPDDAEEAAQRAFVRLWRRRRHLREDGSLRALLYHSTRSIVIDLQRKRQRRRRARARMAPVRKRPPTPEERLREKELRGAIEDALSTLSPRRREAFILCRVNGLSHREAAEVMELAPQTISNHVTAALQHIRAILAPASD